MTPHSEDLWARLDALNTIGIALSAEKDPQRLLELILLGAKRITHADGGTLYALTPERTLELAIVRTDSLGMAMGGTTDAPVPFPPVPLYNADGAPNLHNVASCAVLQDRTINIPDAYTATDFDFSGTRDFDRDTGYRSRSFLTVPLKNHEGDAIGVLQLINARRPGSGELAAFSPADQRLAESLASQAAVALSSQRLIADMKRLFDSIVRLIATAIDAKSPHTAGHCARVPELTMRLADAAHRTQTGPLSGFQLDESDRYELEIASWLHDCGKLTTPDHVMEKATKLETLFDRIALIDTRFEVLMRDARIEYLEARRTSPEGSAADPALDRTYRERLASIEADRNFLRRCNIGSEEPMSEVEVERVHAIGAYRWRGPDGAEGDFLSNDEITNLTIRRGTLTEDERQVINHHIVVTIKMLESLPFPKHLARVPEFAGGHHERIDGRGYPRGLKGEQMSVQARAMAIADVFEALTDAGRPYKRELCLSEALKILGTMSLNGHIDPDLFQIFVRDGIYLEYAQRFLDPGQIDRIDETQIPGYAPEPPTPAGSSRHHPDAIPGLLRHCPG